MIFFCLQQVLQFSILYVCNIAIGESLKGLDKVTKGKLLSTHPEIDWKNVKGLRDIIAHHYFEVDADQIWWIIENELQPLKMSI